MTKLTLFLFRHITSSKEDISEAIAFILQTQLTLPSINRFTLLQTSTEKNSVVGCETTIHDINEIENVFTDETADFPCR